MHRDMKKIRVCHKAFELSEGLRTALGYTALNRLMPPGLDPKLLAGFLLRNFIYIYIYIGYHSRDL